METVETGTFTFPRWMEDLFISLFNGDGGEGFEPDEIQQAEDFISENKLKSLVVVEDIYDGQIKCTFILMDNYGDE